MPHTQCLGFCVRLHRAFICYVSALVGGFEDCMGGLIVSGSLIYTNIHFHTFVCKVGFGIVQQIIIML